jgi:formate dehydrogenase accessory protein FdhE
MANFWERQIERAQQLSIEATGSKQLLEFYTQLLRAQKRLYDQFCALKDWEPSGDVEKDLPKIVEALPSLLRTVAVHGTEVLASEAEALLNARKEVIEQSLCDYWRNPSDIQFFAKAILQPYLHWLRDIKTRPVGRELAGGERTCPFCGGAPQLSFLQSKESNAESGNRDLLCSTCLFPWEFRRVVCANCGEERPAKLGYFQSPEFDHVRIEACDSCKHYIKGIDLTRLGHAVPLVDEIYAAALDLWAREHGYHKIELNLVGV